MWPFGRKAGTSSAPEAAAVVPQMHFDWKGLPPIQRTVAEHPLTIPTEAFASELTTHEDPRAVAQPLGHKISLEAPAGIVLGIARPQTRSLGSELVAPRRAGRRPALQRFADEPVPDVDAADIETSAEETSAPTAPVRRLPTSNEPPPSLQLTRATAENGPQPLPLAQDVVGAGDEPPAAVTETPQPFDAATELPTYPRLTLGQARRLGLGAPIQRVPDSATSVQRSREAPVPSAAPPAMPPAPSPVVSESTNKEEDAQRFKPFLLDFLVNKRQEVVAPAPISRRQRIALPLPVSRSAAADGPVDTEPKTAPSDIASSPVDLMVPASLPAPVQRVVESAAAEDIAAESSPTPIDGGPIAELAGPPAIVAATNPKRTLLAETATGEAEEGTAAPLPALPLAASPVSGGADATGNGDADVAVMRSADGDHDDSPPAAPAVETMSAMPPDGHAIAPLVSQRAHLAAGDGRQRIMTIQRTADSTPSSPHPAMDGAGRQAPAIVDSGLHQIEGSGRRDVPAAIADGDFPVMQRVAMSEGSSTSSLPLPLPLTRSAYPALATTAAMPTTPSVQVSTALERWPSVQTATALLEPAHDDRAPSTIQRAPAHEWTVSAAAEVPATSPSAGIPAAAEATGQGVDEEARMEDLAGKLYDRIRVRLRNELLVDRERAGFLTDLR